MSSPACAIYCRYSSEQQRDSMSIEAQKRECAAFAEKNGWTIFKTYVDQARSGTSDARAAFQEMIAEAAGKDPAFQIVLVHKLDRFARNRYDSIKYKHLLRRKGIRVVSATQPISGSGDPTDVLLETMLEGMDEFYSLNLARESLKGMAENARRGWWNGGRAPFGYQLADVRTEKGTKKKLRIDPAEAGTVRKIYGLYLKGAGAQAILQQLAADKKTARGRYPFTRNMVLGILRNEKYAGDCLFGKQGSRSGRNVLSRPAPLLIQNSHPAIIRRPNWDRVQQLLAARSPETRSPRSVSSEFLFSGLVLCGLCRSHMVGSSAAGHGGRYRYYVCNKQLRLGRTSCPQNKFNAQDLERVVLERLRVRLTSRESLIKMIRGYNETLRDAKEDLQKQLPRLQRAIAEIDQRRGRLFEAIETGKGLTREDIAPRLQELAEKKADLEQQKIQLQDRLDQAPIESSPDRLQGWIRFFRDLFEDKTFLAQKSFAQSLILSIEIGTSVAVVTYSPAFCRQPDQVPLSRHQRQKKSGPGLEDPEPLRKGSYEPKLAPPRDQYKNLPPQVIEISLADLRHIRQVKLTRPERRLVLQQT